MNQQRIIDEFKELVSIEVYSRTSMNLRNSFPSKSIPAEKEPLRMY